MSGNLEKEFAEAVREAAGGLCIRGGCSKNFYGLPAAQGVKVLDTRGHSDVVDYEPTELVVTARSGTPLEELEALLAQSGQMLAFEPPHFGPGATLGGMVAAGLSGPRRAQVGAVRDFVLGVKLLDGRGDVLSFGGQVMKNVAGYDVSRALAGSLGTLGLILEVSLKTLPRPAGEVSLHFELPEQRAIDELNRWGGRPLPISASAWTDDGELCVRLSGAPAAIAAAREKLGGELIEAPWTAIREQTHPFFARAANTGTPLWRLSLPSVTPAEAVRSAIAGEELVEWGGALRWFASRTDPSRIREIAQRLGGHATLFRAPDELRGRAGVFQPLSPTIMDIHRRLKQAFDPRGIFNRGRMYPEL